MRIALDAMGGDIGIEVNVKAALLSLQAYKNLEKIYLVGNQAGIESELSRHSYSADRIVVVHSPQEVSMKDSPSFAIRQKKESSLAIMLQLQKDKEVDASVSAGNTGAVMAFALRILGRIPGINRPGLASPLPTRTGTPVVLIDIGANTDCKARNLLEFAYMGSLYAEHIIGVAQPTVGIINIGEESSKGNDVTLLAHQLLERSELNFAGNAEGRDILSGKFNVIVMDGFVGNIVLKLSESLMVLYNSLLREGIKKSFKSKIGALLMKPAFEHVKQKINYESYGGAILMGVIGICIISHGRSTPVAIKNAIFSAMEMKRADITRRIEQEISQHDAEGEME
ncbi:MAG: phosphate acyltransferase PlsX [Candidatus Delongbacteria bacterium]|nr:phosphate acyltransferase PlsX [Candidatus Delongbacteria bacterium]